jgi:predicted nucleotidyltransferase/uncharacterized protein (UPF0332 family)
MFKKGAIMESKIKKRANPNKGKYHKSELDIAREFTKEVVKELGSLVKAIVLFGSQAKNLRSIEKLTTKKSDIDILVVINDLSVLITPELAETYKIIMEKKIASISKKIHLTTLMMTSFWDLIRTGDPIVINMLRDGFPIIDNDFFEPLQFLLYRGKIRPSWEAIWTYYTKAPKTIQNSKWHILQAVLDLYWAVIDSAHAALMRLGNVPPSPAHVPDMLDERLHKKGFLHKKYVTIARDFYHLSKQIIRRDITEIQGKYYDKYLRDADDFVQQMKKIVDLKNLDQKLNKDI